MVGVNSDASVKRLGKGDDRPINPEEDRLAIIRAISGVDFAFIFDEDTPEESIRRLSPVIHVKGGDYTFDQLPEAKEVLSGNGIVAILPTLKGRSTTRIAETIRRK